MAEYFLVKPVTFSVLSMTVSCVSASKPCTSTTTTSEHCPGRWSHSANSSSWYLPSTTSRSSPLSSRSWPMSESQRSRTSSWPETRSSHSPPKSSRKCAMSKRQIFAWTTSHCHRRKWRGSRLLSTWRISTFATIVSTSWTSASWRRSSIWTVNATRCIHCRWTEHLWRIYSLLIIVSGDFCMKY